MRLIVRYFGRTVAANATAALKGSAPTSTAEASLGTRATTKLRRGNSTQAIAKLLPNDSNEQLQTDVANQKRSMMTVASPTQEILTPFDLQLFGSPTTTKMMGAGAKEY